MSLGPLVALILAVARVVARGAGLIPAIVTGVIASARGRVGLRCSVSCALTGGLAATAATLVGGVPLASGVSGAVALGVALGTVALIPAGRGSLALFRLV